MKAESTTNFKGDTTVHLELSFTEMHIIMQAMFNYSDAGFTRKLAGGSYNEHHAAAAEKLHGELLDVYTENEGNELAN